MPPDETRLVIAPRAHVPLYRHTYEQHHWSVTTTDRSFGRTTLLLHRRSTDRSSGNAIYERRAERALARIAALEQHPNRVATVLHLAGSATAAVMLTISLLTAATGHPSLLPIFIGAASWATAAIAAPMIRSWRLHRTQHALHREYQALRNSLP